MKQNKKAILGFAVAMIFSLGIMQGISTKNNKQDMSLQHVTAACFYAAANTEMGPGMEASLNIVGGALFAEAYAIAPAMVAAGPVGWVTLGLYGL